MKQFGRKKIFYWIRIENNFKGKWVIVMAAALLWAPFLGPCWAFFCWVCSCGGSTGNMCAINRKVSPFSLLKFPKVPTAKIQIFPPNLTIGDEDFKFKSKNNPKETENCNNLIINTSWFQKAKNELKTNIIKYLIEKNYN